MSETVNYINHLQKNIKELSDKRDKLKKKLPINSTLESRQNKHESSGFTVHQNSSGAVGIEISGFSEEGVSLSKLLELVLEEGLEVVCCLSTKVNGRLLHSLQCEVCTCSRFLSSSYVIRFFLWKSIHTTSLLFYILPSVIDEMGSLTGWKFRQCRSIWAEKKILQCNCII